MSAYCHRRLIECRADTQTAMFGEKLYATAGNAEWKGLYIVSALRKKVRSKIKGMINIGRWVNNTLFVVMSCVDDKRVPDRSFTRIPHAFSGRV